MPAALLVLSTGSAQATPAARAGSPGEVTTTFGPKSDDVAQALLLQRDGKIVLVGDRSPGGEDSEFALARYRPNGTLDSSFGTGGKVTTAFGFANAAALEPDGRIVAVGGILVNRPDFDFALARYTASGALDSSFGSGGKVTTTFGPTADFAQALALQPDGKIVVAGSSGFPQQRDGAFALARYDAKGALDLGVAPGEGSRPGSRRPATTRRKPSSSSRTGRSSPSAPTSWPRARGLPTSPLRATTREVSSIGPSALPAR